MKRGEQGASAPTHTEEEVDRSYDDLLREIEELRGRLDHGATQYEVLREEFSIAWAALTDVSAAASFVVSTARQPLQNGKLHIVNGVAFRALSEVVAKLNDAGEDS